MLVGTILLTCILAIVKVACQGSLSADQSTEQSLIQALFTNYNQNVKPDVITISNPIFTSNYNYLRKRKTLTF
jgi:hypothetical protein